MACSRTAQSKIWPRWSLCFKLVNEGDLMSTKRVSTEKELAKAVEEDTDTIEIEGDLKDKVIRIKATGKIAWAICIGCIAAAVVSTLSTGGIGSLSIAAAAPVAVSILGIPTTIACVTIAVAAGGVGVLNKLRGYDLSREGGMCILKKS